MDPGLAMITHTHTNDTHIKTGRAAQTQTCCNWKPAFFSVVSHWILSHTACVSGLPGSRTLLAVIFPKNLSTDWRGMSFSRARHTYGSNRRLHARKINKEQKTGYFRAARTCLDLRWSVSSCSRSSLCSSIKLTTSVSSQLCLTFSTTSR